MPLAMGVFIFHASRYNFTYIGYVTHGDNFGDVQIRGVSVLLDWGLLTGHISGRLVGHGGCTKTSKGQN